MTTKQRVGLQPADKEEDEQAEERSDLSSIPIPPDTLNMLRSVANANNITPTQALERLLTNADPIGRQRPQTQKPSSRPARLSVNINRDTHDALQEIAEDRGLTMTEAVRRLIGYGIIVYRSARDGNDILLRRNGRLERLLLLD